MAERQIEDLIEELKTLRLRETAIIAQLEAANRANQDNKSQTGTTGIATQLNTELRDETTVNGITQGDRVRITNRVRKPATWTRSQAEWSEAKERRATVTRVTPEQIHLLTDNGVRTWRAPNNVKKIP
jgi:hypothetical protein